MFGSILIFVIFSGEGIMIRCSFVCVVILSIVIFSCGSSGDSSSEFDVVILVIDSVGAVDDMVGSFVDVVLGETGGTVFILVVGRNDYILVVDGSECEYIVYASEAVL